MLRLWRRVRSGYVVDRSGWSDLCRLRREGVLQRIRVQRGIRDVHGTGQKQSGDKLLLVREGSIPAAAIMLGGPAQGASLQRLGHMRRPLKWLRRLHGYAWQYSQTFGVERRVLHSTTEYVRNRRTVAALLEYLKHSEKVAVGCQDDSRFRWGGVGWGGRLGLQL